MKIFISHSHHDMEIANELRDLLQLGTGTLAADIFCSSVAGAIPNGAYFVQHIIKALHDADLVIALLSREYFRSDFCKAEAGAGQLKQHSGSGKSFFSFLIKPADYRDLDGILHGSQSHSIDESKGLDELRDRVITGIQAHVPTAIWYAKRSAFLKNIEPKVKAQFAKEILELIYIVDTKFERSASVNIIYKSKLRVSILNSSSEKIEVSIPTWVAQSGQVPIQPPRIPRYNLKI